MIDYTRLQSSLSGMASKEAAAHCDGELPRLWMAEYRSWVSRSNIHQMTIGSHTFLFDFTSEFSDGCDDVQEDRVVAAYGCSTPPVERRDASRMKGYLGPTGKIYGAGYDKGHFIAHSMGGDDLDSINWFPQERCLNQGKSEEGRLYRSLEAYCARTPGTFFFSRPIYEDISVRPVVLEIGLLRERTFEIYRFDNRRGPCKALVT